MDEYEKAFKNPAMEDFPILQTWMDSGYVTIQKSYLMLTETGLGLSDYLGPQLISPQIWAAMKEWEGAQAHDIIPWMSQKL